MVRNFRACWKELVLTDIVFKAIAFAVLTPLVGLLFQTALAVSGSGVLSDQNILFFFLGPAGWVSFIVVGAVGLAIIALEQSALLGILAASQQRRRMGIVGALRFSAANAWPVLRVAVCMAGLTLLLLAPFVAAGGLAYTSLLTRFDINYYLMARPPAFLAAVGIAALLGIALATLLLRVFSHWLYALPLVLFESIAPSRALRESRRRSPSSKPAHIAAACRSLSAWARGSNRANRPKGPGHGVCAGLQDHAAGALRPVPDLRHGLLSGDSRVGISNAAAARLPRKGAAYPGARPQP